jgi:hypothetical protein
MSKEGKILSKLYHMHKTNRSWQEMHRFAAHEDLSVAAKSRIALLFAQRGCRDPDVLYMNISQIEI